MFVVTGPKLDDEVPISNTRSNMNDLLDKIPVTMFVEYFG